MVNICSCRISTFQVSLRTKLGLRVARTATFVAGVRQIRPERIAASDERI
jgi:formate-dependent phosphoribosylglycinamide formyltransferase (GAR transformylase)